MLCGLRLVWHKSTSEIFQAFLLKNSIKHEKTEEELLFFLRFFCPVCAFRLFSSAVGLGGVHDVLKVADLHFDLAVFLRLGGLEVLAAGADLLLHAPQ